MERQLLSPLSLEETCKRTIVKLGLKQAPLPPVLRTAIQQLKACCLLRPTSETCLHAVKANHPDCMRRGLIEFSWLPMKAFDALVQVTIRQSSTDCLMELMPFVSTRTIARSIVYTILKDNHESFTVFIGELRLRLGNCTMAMIGHNFKHILMLSHSGCGCFTGLSWTEWLRKATTCSRCKPYLCTIDLK